jgi:hypothetical protein
MERDDDLQYYYLGILIFDRSRALEEDRNPMVVKTETRLSMFGPVFGWNLYTKRVSGSGRVLSGRAGPKCLLTPNCMYWMKFYLNQKENM